MDNIPTSTLPWTEKYRPKNIDDLVASPSTINKVKNIVMDLSMPNMIISGSPGVGKTTTISWLSHKLLGKHYRQGVLELNASDERGIKAVQDSIIYFCKKKLVLNKEGEHKYATHKIVLLDEADNMTIKAQHLINNLMDQYHKTTRFAFTCNNSNDIIEAIQSRCIILRYKRLTPDQLQQRLIHICKLEHVKYNIKGIQAIISTCNGDMRQAINNLQLTHTSYDKVTIKTVYKICNKPHPDVIISILHYCNNNNIVDAFKSIRELHDKGFSGHDIIREMINVIKITPDIGLETSKSMEFIEKLSDSYMIISGGIDTPLQLSGCIASLCHL
jgi:replication factor C subunit 2/4